MKALIIIGLVLLTIPTALFRAFVFLKMWGWFIVPVFDVPKLNLGVAFSLLLFTRIITQLELKKEDQERDFSESVAHSITSMIINIFFISIIWIIAWITYLII